LYANIGDTIKYRNGSDTQWEDGWAVQSVGTEATDQEVRAFQTMWKRQREASDVPQGTFKKD
jgi:hypothetical protein